MKHAIVLLSGGLDSATSAAMVSAEGVRCTGITFRYGQRHEVEVSYAEGLARHLNFEAHHILDLPVDLFSSALTGSRPVPHDAYDESSEDIPDTYVPARNIIFLSYGIALAESVGADAVVIGANAVDYSGYPDCRPEFFDAYQRMTRLGTKRGVEGNPVEILVPLQQMTKAEIIQKGVSLGLDYSLTHSCYDPGIDGTSCGTCDSCNIRKKGFSAAGVPDPTRYRR